MIFSGHETFHIREGWLHKGLKGVKSNPHIFTDSYATDHLGVGKNMVSSMRYWLIASGLIVEHKVKTEDGVKPKAELSETGKIVFKFDPYFEEDLTLWAIHYKLATNKERSTSWYWLFNQFPMRRFDSQTFVTYLSRWIAENSKKEVVLSSVQKDLNCIVRTYTPPSLKHKKVTPEDSFECPLASLKLMEEMENTGTYKLNFGNQSIPLESFGFALLSYLEHTKQKEAKLNDIANGDSSPGRIFLMNSETVVQYCEGLEDRYGKKLFHFSRTAGMNIVRISPNLNSLEFLKGCYEDK